MDENSKSMMESVQRRILEQLERVEPGSNEAKALLNDLDEVREILERQKKLEIEERKMELSSEFDAKKLELQSELDNRKLDVEEMKWTEQREVDEQKLENEKEAKKKERKTGLIATIGGWILAGIGVGVTIWQTVENHKFTQRFGSDILKFEEDGNYVNSFVGKSYLSNPFRKG